MKKGSKAAIVCCSNGQRQDFREKLEKLKDTLRQIGICPVCSQYIFERESVFSGTAKERAEAAGNRCGRKYPLPAETGRNTVLA